MLIGSLALVGIIVGVSLIASVLAALCRLLAKSNALSRAVGTLTMPVLICAAFVYWVMTMEVDDAPPGNVLVGTLTAVAVVTPIALLASHLTIRFLSRRAPRNGS